jgi:hypothetical protein
MSTSGVISGTPTVRGTFTVNVAATNGISPSASQSYGLVILDKPTITSPAGLGNITVGTAFSNTVTATGQPSATFSATGLPTGITINSGTGVISGTVLASNATYGNGGPYSITVTATNSVGADSKTYTGSLNAALNITTTSLNAGTYNVAYSQTIAATGYPAASFSATGLPAGLSISTSGVISGTPTTRGTFTVNVTATNGVGADATQSYGLVILDKPTITTASLGNITVGTAFNNTISATGQPSATFSATGLPTGITLNSSTGVISGTILASDSTYGAGGNYSITVTATNSVGTNVKTYTGSIYAAPVFTTTSLNTGTYNVAYSQTVNVTGNPAATLAATGLPSGLSMSASGVISGTPTTRGTFTVNVTATNGINPDASQSYGLVILDKPTITLATLGNITVGTAFSNTITATGQPSPTFSAPGLPAGVTLNSGTGVISGTVPVSDPTYGAGGTYSITVTATNSVGTDSKTYTGNIWAAPVITTTSLAAGTTTVVYSQTVVATGNPAPTFTATGLPAGLSISTAGKITGTPTVSGTFTPIVTASNGIGTNATRSYGLVISASPAITGPAATALGNITVGTAFSNTITATGQPSPTFSATGLPTGITVDSSTGVISGTILASDATYGTGGSYSITVTASNGVGTSATRTYTGNIYAAPVFTTKSLASGVVGTVYSQTIVATGSPAVTYAVTSALPSGLNFTSATGVISGTPSAPGSYAVSFNAINSVATTPKTFGIVITGTPPTITTTSLVNGTVGTAYSQTISGTGTPSPTFAKSSGTLPTGLALSAAGVLSGTPTVGGSYTFVVQATNNISPVATQSFTVAISSAPTITTTTLTAGATNASYSASIATTGYPTPTVSITSGSLPAGLSLASNGTLAGTPTVAGSYTFTVTATNAVSPDATKSYTLSIAAFSSVTTIATVTTNYSNMVVDSNNNIYYADSGKSITKIDSAGTSTPFAGSSTTSGSVDGTGTAARFQAINGMTMDSSNNIYIADFTGSGGNVKIRKITPAGVVTTLTTFAYNSTGTNSGAPDSMQLGPNGNFYLSYVFSKKIAMVTPTGTVTTAYDGTGAPDYFGSTTVNGNGIFITISNSAIMYKVASASSLTAYATLPDTASGRIVSDSAGNIYEGYYGSGNGNAGFYMVGVNGSVSNIRGASGSVKDGAIPSTGVMGGPTYAAYMSSNGRLYFEDNGTYAGGGGYTMRYLK